VEATSKDRSEDKLKAAWGDTVFKAAKSNSSSSPCILALSRPF